MPIKSEPKAQPRQERRPSSADLDRVAPFYDDTLTTPFGEYRYVSSPLRARHNHDIATNTATSLPLVQRREMASKRANNTGLPNQLKTGIELLAGLSMDHVKVHYNSLKPAKFNAHAYAQGVDIHLAPGQEKHLPHEAWHVVQQQQGRVKPSMQMQGNVNVNDNAILENEADVMGAKAAQFLRSRPDMIARNQTQEMASLAQFAHQNVTTYNNFSLSNSSSCPIQRVIYGVPPFAIHTPAPLTADAGARLQSAVDILVTTINNDPNLHVQQLVVSVEAEGGADFAGGQSNIEGDNPAETITVLEAPNPFPTIQITVQRPFAQAATVGELLGLLAHEIGVHNIPSDFRGINDAAVNVFAPIHTPRKIHKGNTASGGYEFADFPLPGLGQPPEQRDGRRQHDHVMVADILRNPPVVGVPSPLTRANVYFETVLNIGDAIWADPLRSLAERQEQTSELIHLYLVDIARIIATDDGRLPPLNHTVALGDVYGELFDQVVLPQRGATHPWIPQTRPKANLVSLGVSLTGFIARIKFEKSRRG
ncbi:MAG: DUF4157 domain-containing protein [Undibacterium sp.]|nr:DUF4157 domain-containing protein [Undibacterium sp.]